MPFLREEGLENHLQNSGCARFASTISAAPQYETWIALACRESSP